MVGIYSSSQQVREELAALCKACDAVVEDSTSNLLYATAAEPRRVLKELRIKLQQTPFRESSVQIGDQESFITLLDTIDRSFTVKIRRML